MNGPVCPMKGLWGDIGCFLNRLGKEVMRESMRIDIRMTEGGGPDRIVVSKNSKEGNARGLG